MTRIVIKFVLYGALCVNGLLASAAQPSKNSKKALPKTELYAEVIMRTALVWLPSYIESRSSSERILNKMAPDRFPLDPKVQENWERLSEVAVAVQKLALDEPQYILSYVPKIPTQENDRFNNAVSYRFSWRPNGIVQFLKGDSPLFHLKNHAEIRDAVTGDEIDSAIVFNSTRLSDPAKFSYADALRLWIHELGHKVRAKWPDVKTSEIDQLAVSLSRHFGGQSLFSEPNQKGERVFVINGPPQDYPLGRLQTSLFKYHLSQKPLAIYLESKGGLINLGDTLEVKMNESKRPHVNHFEIERAVYSVQWKTEDTLEFSMNIQREPENYLRYLQTDLGGPHRRRVLVKLHRGSAEPVELLSADPMAPVLQRATDASAKILSLEVNSNRRISGEIEITTHTEKFFHAPGYPTSEAELLVWAHGRSFRIDVEMTAMDDSLGWHGMPAEVYKKTLVKRARLEGELPSEIDSDFDVEGLISRFLVLGQNYVETWEESMKLTPFDNPMTLTVSCENLLR